ncbi:MAG: 50S ribosomal protein L9 [Candidatus Omnitrophica bacterium]|nr:50S ribosomal protein L9 [Candidatus Omnitrophota bacterium]
MRVILLKDVEKIGSMGDVVGVKDGYAANFLIPRKLAKRVTRKSVKFLDDEKKKTKLKLKRLKEKAEKQKENLENISCTLTMQASEDEKLFGTVTSQMIKEAYAKEGIELDKKQIQLKEHINKLGVYNIDIKLHPEVTANIKLWLVRK